MCAPPCKVHHFSKGDNIFDFLSAFLDNAVRSKKSSLKGKNLLSGLITRY